MRVQLYVVNIYRRQFRFLLPFLSLFFSFFLASFLPFYRLLFHLSSFSFLSFHSFYPCLLTCLLSLFLSCLSLFFKRAEKFFNTNGYPSTVGSFPSSLSFFFPLLAAFNYITATIFTPLIHHAVCFRERNIFAVPRMQKPCVAESCHRHRYRRRCRHHRHHHRRHRRRRH